VLGKLRGFHREQSSSTVFNIPPLDRLLGEQQQHNLRVRPAEDQQVHSDQPAVQRQTRDERNSTGTLIEVVANSTSAGKTTLLYLIATLATLPNSVNGLELSGKNSAVVVIDTDDRFDVSRLSSIMKNHIKHCSSIHVGDQDPHGDGLEATQEPNPGTSISSPSDAEIESLIHTSLRHVHIFRPQSFSSLVATLESLPAYLLGPSTHHSRSRPLHSIILDSTSAFYWQFRAEEEIQRVLALDNDPSNSKLNRSSNYTSLMRQIQSLSVRFECPVIATTWKLSSPSRGDGPYLNPTFPTLPTLRLEVQRVSTRPFGPRMSVEQAESLRKMREEAVTKHQFRVVGGKAGFGFVVSEEGVVINDDL
jgi:hypothetical protein